MHVLDVIKTPMMDAWLSFSYVILYCITLNKKIPWLSG
jgi:hypothetical protein